MTINDHICLQPMIEENIEDACSLISLAMNGNEARWAEKSMRFHFGCANHGLSDGRSYFIHNNNGKLIGMTGLHNYNWGPEENVWLAWFAVHPDFQRQGIGAKLLSSIEKKAKSMGYSKLFVETYRNPEFAKARKFYGSNGFVEVGEINGYLPCSSGMVVLSKRIG